MSFGVSTGKAHLDVRNVAAPDAREIDWAAVLAWTGDKSPRFAGRYFLGQPHLWAHGEGTEALGLAADLNRVAPIQRADAARQAVEGVRGERYGREDAIAFCQAIATCLSMGELSVSNAMINVFLEVDPGATLAADYWQGWCTAVYGFTALLEAPGLLGFELADPFLPCILCSFSKAASGKYQPAEGVTDCLDAAGRARAGKQTRCYGFWAIAADIAAHHVAEPPLDWTLFETYQQPQGTASQPVFVHVWRYLDMADPPRPGIPESGKITRDATPVTSDGRDPSLDRMLTVEHWFTISDPTMFGVDRGADLSDEIACLTRTPMRIRHLPEGSAVGGGVPAGPAIHPPGGISGPTEFAVRYYSAARDNPAQRAKDLSPAEARAISRARVSLVAVWQVAFGADGRPIDFDAIPAYLATAANGENDARNAFAYAANRIGQPPWTPVYFAVDTNVRADALWRGRMVPTPEQIASYFGKVRDGYRLYLADQKDAGEEPVPYYIGVYASSNVLELCYIRGLATHFWQAWPPPWGDGPGRPNVDVWAHTNLWQVVMENAGPAFDAAGILACRRPRWTVELNGITAGSFRLRVRGELTDPIDFDADRIAVRDAVADVSTLAPTTVAAEVLVPSATRRLIHLRFSSEVGTVEFDRGTLAGPAGPPAPTADIRDPGFVDLDVAWGDPGGWQVF